MRGVDSYYWDSCLFLAWLKDEERPEGEMSGVREFLDRAKRSEIRILTSVLTLTEVLEAAVPTDAGSEFQRLFRRRGFGLLQVTRPIAERAAEIRKFYRDSGSKLPTPDAIHLASAIHYEAAAFHTFDKGKSGKGVGLLQLDGDVAGHPLRIHKPLAEQQSLDLRSE
ncbi:MAG: hypothetical protein DHS20C21_00540 [Gemmatimonadota bacterium]|nr:MAG: hypothetical protein DHS20C21_00540 [Gemmatimonadota bacterium]